VTDVTHKSDLEKRREDKRREHERRIDRTV